MNINLIFQKGERLFVTFMILISSTITGYTINKIGEILDQFDIHERKVK